MSEQKITKDEAINLIARSGLSIEIIYDYKREESAMEYARQAAIRLAKLVHVVIDERANSLKFRQYFGDLRRLEKELVEYRRSNFQA